MASAEAADPSDFEKQEAFQHLQRLKAAVHYTVCQICEEIGVRKELTFSKPMLAAIAELTFHQAQTYALDLELFAKHAKRTTINEDDVKLLVRRNEKLSDCILKISKDINRENEAEKAKRKSRKRKKDAAAAAPQDGDTTDV